VVALSLAGACATDVNDLPVASGQARILGGTAVAQGEFPSVVAIRLKVVQNGQTGQGLCTGSLIAPDTVLTAAHCVSAQVAGLSSQEEVAANMQVVLDSTQGFFGGRTVAVSAAIPNPGFTRPTDPDLGIIKLKEKITDRPYVRLNFDHDKAPVGMSIKIVGYGMSKAGDGSSAGTEYKIDQPTIACSTYGFSDAMFICLDQNDGTGICEGDSGGPSFSTIDGVLKQVGVTSFGGPDCGIVGATMRVDAGRAFVLQNAPDAFCQADGSCDDSCGKDGLPADPDCQPCSHTSDCSDDHVCDNGYCVPGPSAPGGAGAPCTSNDECVMGSCIEGPDGHRCAELCQTADPSCPESFDCVPGDANGNGACWPADGGGGGGGCGCTVGGRSDGARGGALLLVIGAVVFGVRRRRRG
jgi:MYXO-CTERM domain-containing protein